ncbi:hypothetical protein [Ekhidna sp.]|uniref:hypothetical protein n=1 Tax=Ekhidna sp. TaxID=2608089 RepID=UPI003299D0B7
MKKIIPEVFKGGTYCLLCFLLAINFAHAQSFFSAQTLPKSANYGTITTRLVPEDIVALIQRQNFTFEEWSSFYHVKTNPNGPAVLGSYKIVDNHLAFSPKFLPDSKVQYIITFSYPKLAVLLSSQLSEQAVYSDIVSFVPPKTTRPEITSVIPNLEIVPANLLRFYVYFSAPMGLENPYDFITIEDSNGKVLVDPFVIVPEGLWNIDRTRLTLLLHPGRIKQGVGPNMTEGDILRAGNDYTLKINSIWKGASGEPLKESFSRAINATNPLRKAINVNLWALKAEQKQIGILTIVTDHPLDQPLAKRMLYIVNKEGKILPSQVEFTSPEEVKILWRPDGSKELELHIDHRLEDVCGNTPLYAFDLEEGTRSEPADEIMLTFFVN